MKASGLIFHPFDPTARHFGYRLTLSYRWGHHRLRSRLRAPSEDFACRLMPVPFTEDDDPPDPSC